MAKKRDILSQGLPQKTEGAPLLGEVPLLENLQYFEKCVFHSSEAKNLRKITMKVMIK